MVVEITGFDLVAELRDLHAQGCKVSYLNKYQNKLYSGLFSHQRLRAYRKCKHSIVLYFKDKRVQFPVIQLRKVAELAEETRKYACDDCIGKGN
jgi:hypothetical protein